MPEARAAPLSIPMEAQQQTGLLNRTLSVSGKPSHQAFSEPMLWQWVFEQRRR
jgi:hypothetical protein